MASANSDWTQHVIYELEGGILYSIWVKAVKNERSSESSHILITKTCKFIVICTKKNLLISTRPRESMYESHVRIRTEIKVLNVGDIT